GARNAWASYIAPRRGNASFEMSASRVAPRHHGAGCCAGVPSGRVRIEGAWCCPLPEWIEYGLAHAMPPDLISKIFANRKLPIVIYSEVATPFSRCRALCRWLLRAGHKSLKADRLRRLRGGMFGWRHKNGPVSRPLKGDAAQTFAADNGRSGRAIPEGPWAVAAGAAAD
ncbi:unnamed protein product, partial [Prorocentrum cordatum]